MNPVLPSSIKLNDRGDETVILDANCGFHSEPTVLISAMNKSTGSKPNFNQVRARQDREYAADVLLTVARRRAKYIRTVSANDHDDVCIVVVMSLMKDWEAGVDVSDLVKWVDARLYRKGIDYGRKADRSPVLTLDAPVSEEGSVTHVDTIADPKATVEERLLAKERIQELGPELERLEEYLAQAHPRVRVIHELAMAGVHRTVISETLAAKHGIAASPDVVAQVLSRDLRGRFPKIKYLWEARSTSAEIG